MRLLFYPITLISILLPACLGQPRVSPEVREYGFGMDSTRVKLGLPVIEGQLKFDTESMDYAGFSNTKDNSPGTIEKAIYWGDSGLVLERNYFHGPNGYRLQVYYGYRKYQDWVSTGYGCSLEMSGEAIELDKRQADSVLKSWGIHFD